MNLSHFSVSSNLCCFVSRRGELAQLLPGISASRHHLHISASSPHLGIISAPPHAVPAAPWKRGVLLARGSVLTAFRESIPFPNAMRKGRLAWLANVS